MRTAAFPGSPHLPDVATPGGETWLALRKTLEPRYGIVWRDLAVCHLSILAGLILALFAATRPQPWVGFAAALPAALWIGFWLHALLLFGHEAAHYNLARDRRWNDRLGDLLIWSLLGSTTRHYRKSHWQHHTHLGDHLDTETSYHNCMSPAFLLKTITGLYLLEVALRNARNRKRLADASSSGPEPPGQVLASLRTALLHAAVVATLYALGDIAAAFAWLLAVAVVFPFFASVRQIMEHRRLDTHCELDFTQVEHGPLNRMFGRGPLSYFFGAAGFNRHLLHHWDPGISYTCFDQMESFLDRTPLAAELADSRTTYGRTFLALLRERRRDG